MTGDVTRVREGSAGILYLQRPGGITEEVDDELMEQVDIIAGAMTTLLYELLPDGKIVWIFETEHRHLDDLVEAGFGHKVRLGGLATLGPSFFRPMLVDPAWLFNPASLQATIAMHVLMPWALGPNTNIPRKTTRCV